MEKEHFGKIALKVIYVWNVHPRYYLNEFMCAYVIGQNISVQGMPVKESWFKGLELPSPSLYQAYLCSVSQVLTLTSLMLPCYYIEISQSSKHIKNPYQDL